MSVILAVDIVNGKAVKAYAGIRSNYKPLHIKDEDFSNPIKLIRSFKEKINLQKIYIADLDAIRKIGNNDVIIENREDAREEVSYVYTMPHTIVFMFT